MGILDLRALDAGYNQKAIVQNINMSLEAGRIVVLTGPNGVGKSTILKTVSGLIDRIAGCIYLDGTELSSISAPMRADRMAVMMTDRNYIEYSTVFELVAQGRYQYTGLFGRLSDTDISVIDSCLNRVHAAEYRDTEFNKLSDGQKQRVLLARALVQEPEILILDEPTSYLDIGYKLDFIDMIRGLAHEDNIGILMSMHELELTRAVADEVICIQSDGRLGRCGRPEEVLTYEYISELFHITGDEFRRIYNWNNRGQSESIAASIRPPYNQNRKSRYICVQGTMSSAGKSLITAGLCRIFRQDGYRVAPFKSQNMALNSYVTDTGLEMGRAQVLQAEAAGIEPSVCMNPILLKPIGNSTSQVIVNGEVVGNMSSKEYFSYKSELKPQIMQAISRLEDLADIIVVEGAGSPVELNLKDDDIVNMGLAKMLDAPVLLIGDIDRGGIFPQLIGTMSLLEADERERVCGLIVNKFRGDMALFHEGERILEEKSAVPVLGVIPYVELNLEDEDSVSDKLDRKAEGTVKIGIIRLPHMSNFTDFDTFQQVKGLSVGYVTSPGQVSGLDMLIIPGSKSTMDDMAYLRDTGLDKAIIQYAEAGNIVFGICGGYQMLGESISDPYSVETGGSAQGLGLLPVETVLSREKTRTQKKGRIVAAQGPLQGLKDLEYEGYEIHMGHTRPTADIDSFTDSDTGYSQGNIYGTYIHGIFDNREILAVIIKALEELTGVKLDTEGLSDYRTVRDRELDRLAAVMRENLDMKRIYEILGITHE